MLGHALKAATQGILVELVIIDLVRGGVPLDEVLRWSQTIHNRVVIDQIRAKDGLADREAVRNTILYYIGIDRVPDR